MCTTLLLERSSEWNAEVWLGLVDFEKALETVERGTLSQSLASTTRHSTSAARFSKRLYWNRGSHWSAKPQAGRNTCSSVSTNSKFASTATAQRSSTAQKQIRSTSSPIVDALTRSRTSAAACSSKRLKIWTHQCANATRHRNSPATLEKQIPLAQLREIARTVTAYCLDQLVAPSRDRTAETWPSMALTALDCC